MKGRPEVLKLAQIECRSISIAQHGTLSSCSRQDAVDAAGAQEAASRVAGYLDAYHAVAEEDAKDDNRNLA